MVRILVADQHKQALWALQMALEEAPDFDLVGAVSNVDELIAGAREHEADLILFDRGLPGARLETVIKLLRGLRNESFVIVMSSAWEDGRRVLAAGADAFISKGEEPDWLMDSLRSYAARFIDPQEMV